MFLPRSLLFLVLLGFVAVDEWGRGLARAKTFIADFPLVRFELHWNEGVFGGNHSEMSPWMNQVFISSISLLIVAILALFGFLYRKEKITGLRPGLWFFSTGLSVNVLDRILFGRVTDWIIVKASPIEDYAFNLADVAIALGILILGYLITFQSRRFWADSTARERILVEKKFQFGMAFYLVGAASLVALGVMLSTFIFYRLFLLAPTAPIQLYGYLLAGCIALWCATAWYFGMTYSRSLFGPILALENLIERALKGKCTERDHAFRLRERDSFQHLNALGREIAARSLKKD